ncbi:pathogenicity island protein [Staphylococcus agnetis]|uniref:hypothetical protein n=1 Tax=Staphylococcus agnetis TaxID=985762 RepID=UPI000DFBF369|nr:hypothetical protein [Staphylococcus agnetis]SUK17605.1 pathogenicity island protein [Staphylococcus agnetis]
MKRNVFSKIILSTVVLSGAVASPYMVHDQLVHAAEVKQNNIGQLTQKNESTLHLSLKENISGSVDKNGNLTLSDGKITKKMPSSTKDKKGNEVNLVYKKDKDGFLIQVINSSVDRKTNWAKCALGTGGGAGAGGLSGAGVGSSIPGLGTAAGAIIGGVSGAAVGASSSCFD